MSLRFDLVIEQGSDYQVVFPVFDENDQPQDLTGWTARAQARVDASVDPALHDFADELELSGSDVTLTVPASVSTAWAWGWAFYDLELVAPGGGTTRLVEGRVIVRPEITR